MWHKKVISIFLVSICLLVGCFLYMRTEDPDPGEGPDNFMQLPTDLLIENPVNLSENLENFFNQGSNSKIRFPHNKTFILNRQVVIANVSNLEIDFNDCIIKFPDGCAWETRRVGGKYVARTAIQVQNSRNIVFKNYTIDGNSGKIDP